MQADRDELPGLIEDTSAAIVHRLKEIGYRSNLPERYQLVEALDAMRKLLDELALKEQREGHSQVTSGLDS